jgi:hypothetical protein
MQNFFIFLLTKSLGHVIMEISRQCGHWRATENRGLSPSAYSRYANEKITLSVTGEKESQVVEVSQVMLS